MARLQIIIDAVTDAATKAVGGLGDAFDGLGDKAEEAGVKSGQLKGQVGQLAANLGIGGTQARVMTQGVQMLTGGLRGMNLAFGAAGLALTAIVAAVQAYRAHQENLAKQLHETRMAQDALNRSMEDHAMRTFRLVQEASTAEMQVIQRRDEIARLSTRLRIEDANDLARVRERALAATRRESEAMERRHELELQLQGASEGTRRQIERAIANENANIERYRQIQNQLRALIQLKAEDNTQQARANELARQYQRILMGLPPIASAAAATTNGVTRALRSMRDDSEAQLREFQSAQERLAQDLERGRRSQLLLEERYAEDSKRVAVDLGVARISEELSVADQIRQITEGLATATTIAEIESYSARLANLRAFEESRTAIMAEQERIRAAKAEALQAAADGELAVFAKQKQEEIRIAREAEDEIARLMAEREARAMRAAGMLALAFQRAGDSGVKAALQSVGSALQAEGIQRSMQGVALGFLGDPRAGGLVAHGAAMTAAGTAMRGAAGGGGRGVAGGTVSPGGGAPATRGDVNINITEGLVSDPQRTAQAVAGAVRDAQMRGML